MYIHVTHILLPTYVSIFGIYFKYSTGLYISSAFLLQFQNCISLKGVVVSLSYEVACMCAQQSLISVCTMVKFNGVALNTKRINVTDVFLLNLEEVPREDIIKKINRSISLMERNTCVRFKKRLPSDVDHYLQFTFGTE